MSGVVKARVEAAAARHLTRVIARLADRVRDDLPRGVRVEVAEDGLVLVGRRLRARSLTDARLRGVAR